MHRVVVIGGANVDVKGRALRAYVPRTSNPGEVTVSAGGVGRNIAENLARLGVAVSLVTALGDDANGAFLRAACAQANVGLDHAITTAEPTGTYLAVLDETGEMVSAVSDMRAIDRLSPAHLEAARDMLAEAHMMVADCNLSTECLSWLCEFSARLNKRFLIEPVSVAKARKLLGLKRASPIFAITPNVQQVAALAGHEGEEGIAILHRQGFSNVVVHQGAAGALASDSSGIAKVAPVAVSAIADVTGAGDAAVAGLVLGLLEAYPLADAARLGQCAGALKLASAQSVAAGLSRDSLFRLAGFS